MVTYPPALRRTGLGPPRAIRHFGEAIAEARAAQAPDPQPLVATHAAPVPGPRGRRVVVRLWLPLTLLFLLLAPFALLLGPVLYLAPRRLIPRPFASLMVLGGALLALGGTDVDVDTREARVHIKIF